MYRPKVYGNELFISLYCHWKYCCIHAVFKGHYYVQINIKIIIICIMYMQMLFCFHFHLEICHDLRLHFSGVKVHSFVFVSQ